MMEQYKHYDKGGLLRDRYKKVSDISEGSYGLVSVAKDTKANDKLVAVKFIYPLDFKKDKEEKTSRPSSSPAKLRSPNPVSASKPTRNSILNSLYEEAKKEIRIHEILGRHPNISALYDHFDSCLVLEYCSRGDLYESIHHGKGPSTSQDIKDVFQQILGALEFCHSHGVYHRDLKPENILIAEDWSIKLCDWGLATTTKFITNKDEFDIGSERYMAPELFDPELEGYDASKIDLWSIGVILLTLVFHKNPFQVANYSDKRFLQFVNNREALFDFFSSMSGDMFSVLRFCLNIDPANRDLSSLKGELDSLRYFTIDEEYWGSDCDEDEVEGEVEDDFDFEMETDFYKKGESDSLPASPEKSAMTTSVGESESLQISPYKEISTSLSTTESESINSKSSHFKVGFQEDGQIPHNHRADALLSINTELKPIPIGGSGVRFIRNTRKPFNVASYNQSHNNGRSSNRKFNREEFFTPKSVFNHYMDKYGEQRFGNIQSSKPQQHQTRNQHNPDWKKNNRNPRSWKKTHHHHHSHNNINNNNKKSTKPRNKSNRIRLEYEHSHNQNAMSNSDLSTSQLPSNQRRKSRSYSTSKLRRSFIPTNGASNSLSNGFHLLPHPGSNPHSLGTSATSASGKYVPPYLRSPNYAKSPVIEPLAEEIDRLTLNNEYDEVFHLEDDFELESTSPDVQLGSDEAPTTIDDILFKKPNFKGPAEGNADPIRNYGIVFNHSNGNGGETPNGAIVGRRNSAILASQKRPISNPVFDKEPELSASAGSPANGKYIPPFRRGSHSSATPVTPKIKIDKQPTTDHNGFMNGKLMSSPLAEINNYTSSSVPVNGRDWFSFKKDWSDYE
ncbi:serine/threonine protein kinase [Scheffersomyces xylosifermentans]|uniref:serine/threonine protein kinase n=1 Tax=Scheffersomyces xylosifermentans TaxID=1304137 RepID=UPI00315D12FA